MFSSEEPISVFMRSSMTLVELQNTILQKLGVARSKRVSKLFYRASVAVVSEHAPVAPVVPVIPPSVASLSFAADLHREDDNECDLEDNRTFGELVTEVANNPRTPLGEFRSASQKGLKRRYAMMKKKMNPS
ncbi:hypothetical protein PIB30_040112 [Stylosanthes scabra]|uniref:Uncharacterized protein n=1 Tax=Stylosanthes scabra TaxID=79078 RepID=A0ABU6RF80_9FABA|nr:hypothetical protein [Stylosanthes scabra]